eukprot:g5083.t1
MAAAEDKIIEVAGYRYYEDEQYKLGAGTYGCVYRGEEISTGRKVAIKKQYPSTHEKGVPSCVLRETSLLTILKNSPYVVDLLAKDVKILNKGQALAHMVFELLDSDLNSYAKSHRPLSHDKIQSIMYQIFLGLAHCHSAAIMHRDLKPHNILIDSSDPERPRAKIGDLGFGRAFYPPIPPMTQEIVTLWYRAPEVLLGYSGGHSPAVDVWSLGCIFSELHEGAVLFCGSSEFDQCLKIFQILDWHDFPQFNKQQLSNVVPSLPSNAVDLLKKLLVYDPCERLTAEQALHHPYFASVFKKSDLTEWNSAIPAKATPAKATPIPIPTPTPDPGPNSFFNTKFGMGTSQETSNDDEEPITRQTLRN